MHGAAHVILPVKTRFAPDFIVLDQHGTGLPVASPRGGRLE